RVPLDGEILKELREVRDGLGSFEAVPVWTMVVLAGLITVPLMAWLIGRLLPARALAPRRRWAIAVFLTTVALVLHRVPVTAALVLGGLVVVYGFGRVVGGAVSQTTLAAHIRSRR